MEIPDWLTARSGPVPSKFTGDRRPFIGDRFLERTLHHALAFVEDVMYNEEISSRKGLLQAIEPRLKTVTLFSYIVALSFQQSTAGIAPFTVIVLLLLSTSAVPLFFFARKLLPAAVMSALISSPAAINVIVSGDPLLVLWRFGPESTVGPIALPEELSVTRQGSLSAAALFLRVVTSVSFVFLLTMTTPPNRLMKGVSSLLPGFLKPVFSISYRYIFFLVRKIEQSVMGFRSRTLSRIPSSGARLWAASRIGLLFSISMELSKELGAALESRGYREERGEKLRAGYGIRGRDIAWIAFTVLFCGVMIWRSFT